MPDKNVKVERLPDPHGFITRIKAKLKPNCSVRTSPYCDVIIAMRMQGIPFDRIKEWLEERGAEYSIPASTIHRNLKETDLVIELPYAEEVASKWGQRIDMDPVRELLGQSLVQRRRIDSLVRAEEAEKKTNPRYHDKRIRGEMEVFDKMVRTLHVLSNKTMAHLIGSMGEQAKEDEVKANSLTMSSDAMKLISEMILDGELTMGEEFVPIKPH